jgi:hypothetical protein
MRHSSNPQKLAQISPTSGGRSVGTVRSRTKATELVKTEGVWEQGAEEDIWTEDRIRNYEYAVKLVDITHVAPLC